MVPKPGAEFRKYTQIPGQVQIQEVWGKPWNLPTLSPRVILIYKQVQELQF